MLIEGELYQIKNQSQNKLHKAFKFNNGMVVNPDGTYQNRDKQQLRLQDGECVNMDGKMFRNTLMHQKMIVQKNMKNTQTATQKKVQNKTQVTKTQQKTVKQKTIKKGSGN